MAKAFSIGLKSGLSVAGELNEGRATGQRALQVGEVGLANLQLVAVVAAEPAKREFLRVELPYEFGDRLGIPFAMERLAEAGVQAADLAPPARRSRHPGRGAPAGRSPPPPPPAAL